MNLRNTLFIAVVFLILIPSVAMAEPTVQGPTGLFVNPTAETAPMNHLWLGINFVDLDTIVLPSGGGTEGGTLWAAVLTGGITDTFEVGIGATVSEESDNGFLINAKAIVLEDNDEDWYPAIAVGGRLTQVSGDRFSSIYVVGSKFFWLPDDYLYAGSIHAGLDFVKPQSEDWDLRVFAGADLGLTEDVIAILEWSDEVGGFGENFSYGLRYYFSDTTTGQAGVIDGDLTIGGSFIF